MSIGIPLINIAWGCIGLGLFLRVISIIILAFGGVEAEMVLIDPAVDCINVTLEDIKIHRAGNSSIQ